MEWIYIAVAGALEAVWPSLLKSVVTSTLSNSRWGPLVAVPFAVPTMFLLGEAVKRLPAGTVYATFVGIGVAGSAAIGMVFFGEGTNPGRITSLLLVLSGLVGLNLFSGD